MTKIALLKTILLVYVLAFICVSTDSFACSGCRSLPQGFTDEEVEIISVPSGGEYGFYTIVWRDKKTGLYYQDRRGWYLERKRHDDYIRDKKAANWWPYKTGMPEEGWGK